jgi:beta-phosphoglucomutase-like phosphatase (HAD superfamily)
MGVAPAETWVLEDSALGVTGAAAAGMHVIGFLGGSHIPDDRTARQHGDTLLAAGAHRIVRSHGDVVKLLASP